MCAISKGKSYFLSSNWQVVLVKLTNLLSFLSLMDHKSNGKVLRTQVKTHENGLTEKNCTTKTLYKGTAPITDTVTLKRPLESRHQNR